MKPLLTGLYLALGTLCLFGLPAAILGLSALFSEQTMKLLHSSLSAANSLGFQLEAVVIVFIASAIGLVTAMAVFAGIWLAALAIRRMADGEPVAAPTPVIRELATPVPGEVRTVGHIDHGGTHRRGRARVA